MMSGLYFFWILVSFSIGWYAGFKYKRLVQEEELMLKK